MPRKAPGVIPGFRVIWFGWKVAVFFSVALFVLALLRLHFQDDFASPNSLSRARARSRISDYRFDGNPKIAFLFLARRDLPLDFVWGTFFDNADVANFSIYIHSEPGFVFDESTSRSHFFYGRQLSDSIQVLWGESSMIEAERLLLATALKDPANQRFVLISDSCVPLYNFSYVYSYLMASPRSFVDSFYNVNDTRYSPKMSPVISKDEWRKGSQWFSLIRSHAEVIVDDEIVFPVFKKICKRHKPVDENSGSLSRMMQKLKKQHNCIPDEHYVQTLFAMSDLESELERRTLTYTLWNHSDAKKEINWHPVTFIYADAAPQRIKEMKAINHIYYESEFRTEWCRTNSTPAPCFLFARKFSSGAAMRLLSEGVIGPFNFAAFIA